MSRRPRPDSWPERDGIEPSLPCDVFYLRTEPHLSGFRWVIVKFGAPEAVVVGSTVASSEHAAKVSGRAALERFLAQQNSWSRRARPDLTRSTYSVHY